MVIALQGTPSLYENSSATSVDVPYPAGIVADELLLLHVANSSSTMSATAPAGWTVAKVHPTNNTSPSIAVFYRVADGTETGNVLFDTTAAAGRVTGIMERWSGVDTATPLDVAPVSADSPIALTFTSPSITTVTNDAMLVHTIGINAASAADINTPAGMTLVSKATGTGRRAGAWYEPLATAGASGTKVWEQTSTTELQWAGVTLALRPAGVPATPTLTQRVVGITESPSTSAVVSVRTTNAAKVRLKAGTDIDVTAGVVWGDLITPNATGDSKLTISGLTPGTQYYYRVAMTDSAAVETLDADATVGKFKTAPAGPANFAFCFGSCNNGNDVVAINAIASRADDLFFHLGDLYYSDGTATTVDNFRAAMNEKLQLGQSLYATTNATYTPSDHDGFSNDSAAGKDATAWTNWNTARNDLWPMPSSYYAFTWGRIRFIQLDSRSYKTDPAAVDDAAKTALGTTQKTWFKDQITNATEPVIVVINDGPWIGAAVAGDDGWFGFTTERTELADHMSASGKHIIMLGGDMHAVGADDGTNAPGGIYVFQASPFNQNSSIKGGPYSAGTYPTTANVAVKQYGRCVVTDTGSQIDVAFTGYSADTDTAQLTLTKTVITSSTVSPEGIPSAASVDAPALSTTVTVTPTGVESAAAVGAPALSTTVTVTPTGVESAAAVGAPAANSSVSVAPPGIPSAMGPGSPAVSSVSTLGPTGVAGKAAIGTPVLSQDVWVTPDGIASAAAVGSPELAVDSSTRPEGIAGTAMVGTPSVSSKVTVSPAGIGTKAQAGVPKISSPSILRPGGIPTKKFVGQPSLKLASRVTPIGITSKAAAGAPVLVGGHPFTTNYEATILKKRWKGSLG